jgi:hypothetical protein
MPPKKRKTGAGAEGLSAKKALENVVREIMTPAQDTRDALQELHETCKDILNCPEKVQLNCTRKANLEKIGKYVQFPKDYKNQKETQAFKAQWPELYAFRTDALQKCREQREGYLQREMTHEKLMQSMSVPP